MFKKEWCCKNQIKPLYDNIEYKNYFEPIKKFSKENNNIFDKIINKNIIDDTVIHYYIKSSIDISIIVIYPNAIKHTNILKKVIKELEDKGDIHYIKDIDIDYYSAYNLSYQLYASEKRMKKNAEIIYKIERLGFKNDESTNQIKIIVYTLKDQSKPINGQSAEFKMELRNFFVNEDIKTTIYEPDDDRYPRGYDYLHISDNINQSYEYAGIFFNKNSLKFLKKQKSWRILDLYKTQSIMNKTKEFFYKYSQNELEKLMIFSSGVLYSYGIREANDLDCILLENEIIKPDDIEKLNNKDIDISYKGTTKYNDIWEKELNDRAILFGAKDYKELIINPKYYFYFMGFKIIRLKYDLILRFKRGRPAQLTDLLVIRQMFNLKYKLEIPKTTSEYNEDKGKNIITQVDNKKYLETIKFYLKTRYYINLNIEQIEKWVNLDFNDNSSDSLSKESNSLTGGSNDLDFIELKNQANDKYIYPSQDELLKIGYIPNTIIYSFKKPYLYPGENFEFHAITNFCNKNINEFKPKNNSLRIATFNIHNFISRCNQGIAPIFGTILNPFFKARDLKKFLDLFKLVNADVLCLQELVPITEDYIKTDIKDYNYIRKNFNFSFFNEKMELLGYKYKIISSTQIGKFFDIEKRDYYYLANGIYSKIKLEDEEIYGFKYLNRNILTANITFKNKNIQIFNTHLEYFDSPNKNIKENQIIKQYNDLELLLEIYKNKNIILCGDFNVNIFNKNVGFRYKMWEEKTKYFRNNFNNINRTVIKTNFSQNDQTDFIMYNKQANLKPIYSFTVFTEISDHYLLFSDFI